MRSVLCMILLLISTYTHAQDVGRIYSEDGDKIAYVGKLTVIEPEAGEYANRKWLIPQSLIGNSVECGPQLIIVPQEVGELRINLISVTESFDIVIKPIIIRVLAFPTQPKPQPPAPQPPAPQPPAPQPPTPQPPPPEPPRDPSDGLFATFELFVIETTAKLNDPATAELVRDELVLAMPLISKSGSIEFAILEAQKAMEKAFAKRTGNSLRIDWRGGWREPVNQWITKNIVGSGMSEAQYTRIIQTVISGLEKYLDKST